MEFYDVCLNDAVAHVVHIFIDDYPNNEHYESSTKDSASKK